MKNIDRLILKAAMMGMAIYGIAQSNALAATLSNGHTDIGLAEMDTLALHWHDEETNTEYEPDEAHAYVPPVLSATTRPAGAEWDFLGVAANNTYYQLPESEDPDLLFLGIGAEDATPGAFDAWNPGDLRGANTSDNWFQLALVGLTYTGSGAGVFSAWSDDGLGSPILWMSSSDGLDGTDCVYVTDHGHYNFAFSDEGLYELEFEVRAYQSGSLITSAPATFLFVVPEPTSAVLMLSGVALLATRRKRLA